MAKRRNQLLPWPENAWHTSGRTRAQGALPQLREHLGQAVRDGRLRHCVFRSEETTADGMRWWWRADATWVTPDGARVRARLRLAPDITAARLQELRREDIEAGKGTLELSWALTAEADQPWNLDWPSPLALFFPGSIPPTEWVAGVLPLLQSTHVIELDAASLASMLEEHTACPWYITVLTHDRNDGPETRGMPAVAQLVAPSLQGRIVEIRLRGGQDQIANPVLQSHRTSLLWGGAVIVPPQTRNEAWPMADYSIRRQPGSDMAQLVKDTAETVNRYAALSPHFDGRTRQAVKDLQAQWELPEIEVAPSRVLQEKQQALQEVERLRGEVQELSARLAQEQELNERLDEQVETALERLRWHTGHPLAAQAAEARQQAEEAWAAQEASEAEAERLTGEVTWLRRQLARMPGRSYAEPVPARPSGPESWAELFQLAHDLMPQVRIGEVAGPLQKLRNHPSEKAWLRRVWEALEAYQAYADAKAEHGAQKLPHMHAYLTWKGATAAFPLSWYAAKESALDRRDPKYAAMRNFEVPGHGTVCMQEHIRISGGGRPPAPRMYVFDDLAGPTGQVHVGYIGPHLPMGRGIN